MNLQSQDSKLFLQKVAQFAKISIERVEDLEEEILDYRKKEAAEEIKLERFSRVLNKVAQALYESDFITDELERKRFLKRAQEDPSYLGEVLIKVCNAADVVLIGSPARVAAKPKQAEYDPVAAKAFGWSTSNFLDD